MNLYTPTHAKQVSQRINIDVALFVEGKEVVSIDEVLPIAAAPAIHTDFKNTANKDMRAIMRAMYGWVVKRRNKRFLNLTHEAAVEALAKEWLPELEDDEKAQLLQDIKVLDANSITGDGFISPDTEWLNKFLNAKNARDTTPYGDLGYAESLPKTRRERLPKTLLSDVAPDAQLAQKLQPYIEWYKVYYQHITRVENYKWKALSVFYNTFDIAFPDLADNLKRALAEEKNLLAGKRNFSKSMLIKSASKPSTDAQEDTSEETRHALSVLFDESRDLTERIEAYVEEFDAIHAKRIALGLEGPRTKHHQNPHAISVLLAFRYPLKYYIYKESVWNEFKAETALDYPSLYNFRHKLLGYQIICDQIRSVLLADKELLALHDNYYKEKYADLSDYRLMTQDFIYAIAVHFIGFDRLPQYWDDSKDEVTDAISQYLHR